MVSWWDNVTLYAQWRQFKQIIYYPGWEWEWGKSFYDIKYDGEDFIIQAQDCIAREDVPTRTGYTFVGWKTQDDGTGKSYQPGQIVSWNDDVPRFLYAQWVENRRITYIANDGTDSSVEQYHGQGLKAALKPAETFTREGYTFAGWNSKADGSGNTYAAGQEVSWINNVTLYAIWTKC